MYSQDNKEIINHIFAQLALGNDNPLLDAMADDMQWHWMGSGPWSKSFLGKSEVINGLWHNLRTTIQPPYRVVVQRIIGEENYFAVEMTGKNTTTTHKVYENKYCWICHLKDGQLRQINEYMDTELVTRTFGEN